MWSLIIPEPTFKPDPAKNDAYRSLLELGPLVAEKDDRYGK